MKPDTDLVGDAPTLVPEPPPRLHLQTALPASSLFLLTDHITVGNRLTLLLGTRAEERVVALETHPYLRGSLSHYVLRGRGRASAPPWYF